MTLEETVSQPSFYPLLIQYEEGQERVIVDSREEIEDKAFKVLTVNFKPCKERGFLRDDFLRRST